MTIRDEIEDILVKDIPSTITCQECERDIELEFDLDPVIDDLEELIKKEVKNGTVSMERIN